MKSKKLLSIFMIIGAVILIAGIVITVIGFATGGSVKIREDWWTDVENLNHSASGEVSSVTIKSSFGDVEIVAGSQNRVDVKNYPKDMLKISEVNGELRIIDKNIDEKWYKNSINLSKTPKITVTLSNSELDRIDIDNGAGSVKISGLSVKTVKNSLGAGDLEAINLEADYYDIDSGAGNVTFKNATVGTLTASLGAGDFSFQGDINSSCKVDNGAGSVRLDLAGPESKYRFKCSQGMGSVSVNGYNSNGVTDLEISSGSVLIDIDSGVGDVTIKTK